MIVYYNTIKYSGLLSNFLYMVSVFEIYKSSYLTIFFCRYWL